MKIPIAFLVLAAIPASPGAARTQAAKPVILLKTEIVLIRQNAVCVPDMSHINFDLLPLSPADGPSPPAEREMLEYATGYPVTLLHQKLLQKTPVTMLAEIVFFHRQFRRQTMSPSQFRLMKPFLTSGSLI